MLQFIFILYAPTASSPITLMSNVVYPKPDALKGTVVFKYSPTTTSVNASYTVINMPSAMSRYIFTESNVNGSNTVSKNHLPTESVPANPPV